MPHYLPVVGAANRRVKGAAMRRFLWRGCLGRWMNHASARIHPPWQQCRLPLRQGSRHRQVPEPRAQPRLVSTCKRGAWSFNFILGWFKYTIYNSINYALAFTCQQRFPEGCSNTDPGASELAQGRKCQSIWVGCLVGESQLKFVNFS